MSKDRLEEIETHLNRFMTPKSKPCLFRDDAEFIIRYGKEQAERVQELKGYVETGTYIQRKLRKENRRYREVIESVKNKLGTVQYREYQTVNFRHEIFSDLLEALEESE